MKAVRVHAYGRAPSLDEVAEPRVVGPFDVLVEVGAAGLCRTDLHVIEGQWAAIQNPELPYILGHENAGWVREVGSAVHSVTPGDAVIVHPLVTCGLCIPCRVGDDSHCEDAVFPGLNVDGGMADLLLTNARAIVKLAPNLQPVDVAALADAGLTAYHAVRKVQPLLTPGTHVVVIGSGGLGHIAVQALAAMTPATITVVDRSDAALALAGSIGAHHTVSGAEGSDALVREVGEITGGGAHVVLDFVGEHSTPEQGITMVRNRGTYACVGYGGELRIPTIELVAREIEVVGNLVGTYKDLVELMSLTAQGKVALETTVYPLSAVNDAIRDLDSGTLVGRGILVPGS
ncbi:MAG: adh [Nocardioides sp.]|jgi:NAD+-dependent secondary alcohol dehydrogenase Adh1|nr:adh [Nocardioides sp.]